MNKFLVAAMALAGLTAVSTAQFIDDFDAGTSAGNWTSVQSLADGNVDYAFNYGTWTPFSSNTTMNPAIASAPNSSGGSTVGMRMRVNDTAAAAQAISVFRSGFSISGDHKLTFDMYMNFNEGTTGPVGSGATETATFGLSQNSATGTRIRTNASLTDKWFSVTGEGGASATSTQMKDYSTYTGNVLTTTGYAAAGANPWDAADPYYTGLWPALGTPVYNIAGAPGKRWVQMAIEQIGTTVTWKMDGNLINTQTVTGTSGNVTLGYWDNFSSDSHEDSFVVYDNVRVSVPEPATFAILGLGLAPFLRRRKK